MLKKPKLSKVQVSTIEKKKQSISKESAPWNDFDYCAGLLEKGIRARKFNYSNTGTKEVTLTLVENRTCLRYESVQMHQGCMGF